MKPRCKKGTRRNKKTGNCETVKPNTNKITRCKKGTRRNKKTGNCEPSVPSEPLKLKKNISVQVSKKMSEQEFFDELNQFVMKKEVKTETMLNEIVMKFVQCALTSETIDDFDNIDSLSKFFVLLKQYNQPELARQFIRKIMSVESTKNRFMMGFANNSEATMGNLKFLSDQELMNEILTKYTTKERRELFLARAHRAPHDQNRRKTLKDIRRQKNINL